MSSNSDRHPSDWSVGDGGSDVPTLKALIWFAAAMTVSTILLMLICCSYWNRNRRHQGPPQGRTAGGIDPQVLNSIPVFVCDEKLSKMECSVCLAELGVNEKVRKLPVCDHSFHVECVDEWFKSHSTCPLCRASVGDAAASKAVLDVV